MKASLPLAFALALCASAAPISSPGGGLCAQPIVNVRGTLAETIHDKAAVSTTTQERVHLADASPAEYDQNRKRLRVSIPTHPSNRCAFAARSRPPQ